ncbi:MAG: ATP-binding cassette domain-containing protein, partial [Candidatus Limnocylindrales bacterium]
MDDVDLEIPTGSVTALVGPDGAGKSTLIRLWLGFERPSQGSVTVLGKDPQRNAGAVQRAIGYVPQSSFLYREFSIGDHFDLASTLRPSFDRPFAEARLEDLGLAPDLRVEELSGGERAQVALSLALATRAPTLLLDEPLASMDPLARREFLHVLVATVRTTGQSVVMSSHVVSDIEQAADRIVILGSGRVLLSASIGDVLATHRVDGSPDGQELIGTFPDLVGADVALWRASDASPTA